MTNIETSELSAVLNWRYATKKFDVNRKLTDGQVDSLMEALQLAPSSMGLQPYTFIRIKDEGLRKTLREVSSHQAQITEASELFVFAAHKAITEQDVRNFVTRSANLRDYPADSIEARVQSVMGFVNRFSPQELLEWNARQAYIAMGQSLTSAAFMQIDTCPIEGIDKEAYNRILGLNSLNLQAFAVVAAGFRSPDDALQYKSKVRKSHDELFLTM